MVRGEPSLGVPREVLGLLESLKLRGNEETREVVEALACLLISRAMSERFLHPQHGAIPKFVEDARRQVESFERYIR